VLIPSLYATSPRTRSLRPVRVPSDQNTRWRLPHHLSLLRDKEFLVSPYLPDIYIPSHIRGWTIAATSRTCDTRDEIMLAARTDIEVVNQSLALSIRATSSLVNVAERLHARRLELNTQVLDLQHQIENLRNRLRDERRHRNNLERRNQELNTRVDFWRDYVNTRHLEFEEEMERMHKQFEEFRGMINHQDENIPDRPRTV